MLILTVGHSNHPIEDFLDLLAAHHVEQLADVRTIPKSRHNPQFNREALDARARRAATSPMSTCRVSAVCAVPVRIPSIPGGKTRASEATPITCRLRRSRNIWRS